jgi:hypothetical protein
VFAFSMRAARLEVSVGAGFGEGFETDPEGVAYEGASRSIRAARRFSNFDGALATVDRGFGTGWAIGETEARAARGLSSRAKREEMEVDARFGAGS